MVKISVVVPIYNEEGNVVELHREIKSVCEANNYVYEIIFVDDGSTDDTANMVKGLFPLTFISLRRNFGQTAAMNVGIKKAKYDFIVTMDGDRQNDPADIPKLVNYLLENNLDIVSGWRKHRKDKPLKKFTSRGANFLRTIIVKDGLHDSGCSLKIYRRECFEQINLYGEMHRFIPALCKIKGFTIGEIVVNHRPRATGKTKYNWKRTVKGFLDMISLWFWGKYDSRPLHLFGVLGLLLLALGFVSGIITTIIFFDRGKVSDTGWLVLTALFFISGLQLFVFSIISDIILKTYHETTNDKTYDIKRIISSESGEDVRNEK